MQSKKISFENPEGITLSAKLDLPVNGRPHNYAIFAHCFTCGKNLSAIGNISRALTKNGIGVLRFDFTGLGESEGDFSDTNFSSNVSDLLAAADFLGENYLAPTILIGHSLGGAAVIFAAGEIGTVKAVATIGAPSQPGHVKHLLEGQLDIIREKGAATVSIGGRPFTVRKQFLEDIENNRLDKVAPYLNNALMIMHSPQDEIVSIGNARKLYEAAKHPKSFVTLDGANHLMGNKADSYYAGEIISTWVKRYIELPEPEPLKSPKRTAARIKGKEYTTEMISGQHGMIADEPLEVGGNDFGPTPYDYITMGLGSCTAMTLKMYANRKGWKLDEVTVHLEHDKIHSEDCGSCENNSKAKLDKFVRVIELQGKLDDSQKQRLLEIADKCPVHKTLNSEVIIDTRLR